jgi:hypothetical protein
MLAVLQITESHDVIFWEDWERDWELLPAWADSVP